MKKRSFLVDYNLEKLSPLKKNLKKFLKNKKIEGFFENKKKNNYWNRTGTGENLFYLANKYPRRKVIGIEPFKNGLANIADVCVINKIKNIYLFPNVFQKFIDEFENYFFINAYFFFLILGLKKKHHKRRLVNFDFLNSLILHCLPKGSIFFGSDNLDYFQIVKHSALKIKKYVKISVKQYKKTPTICTKYHHKAKKLSNNVNFLKIDKI